MRINGSLVLVTGASSGIGAATAKAAARRGGRVALLARTRSKLEAVASEIVNAGGEARVYPVDLAQADAADRAAHAVTVEMGTPDVLVNSAGAGRWLFVEETSPEEAAHMMAAPYFAAFHITRAFLPAMLRRNTGHIVNINSPAARMPWPGCTGYAAARWAMKGFTEALRADFWKTGLRVTSIVAGKVDTPYFITNPGTEARSPKIGRLIPTLTADGAASAIVRAIERNQREVIIPFALRVFYVAHALLPRLVERVVYETGWSYSRALRAYSPHI